jgi:PKD repeat protein
MKRLITCFIGIGVTFASFAQAPTLTTDAKEVDPRMNAIVDLEQPAFYKNHPANLNPAVLETRSGRGAVEFIPIGTAYNLYTVLLDGQNQVSYSPDINSVTFVHRHNSGTTGGSGGLSFDVSTDGGATWTDNYALTTSFNGGGEADVTGQRYPSAAIYNPAGNTDPANAFILAHGPSLAAATGSWGATHRLSASLDGSNLSEEYYSNDGLWNDYFPYAITQSGNGNMWDAKVDLDFLNMDVNEFVFNAGTNSFDQTATTVTPDFTLLNDSTTASGGDWQVNFDASGDVGYAYWTGALSTDPVQTIAPTILKTTDAGATWSQLPGYDWGALTAVQDWVAASDGGAGDPIPYFATMDATVGSDGKLHIFAEVYSKFSSDHLDSLYFIYADYTVFMHLSTSDGTDWAADQIGYSLLPLGLFGAVEIPYRMQISRTPSGEKLFMTWTESDSTIFSEHSAPDLFAAGYDIASGEYTPIVNVSAGSDFEYSMFYATMAPISMDNGAGEYELPVVFAQPGADDLSPPQFYYVKGITFTDDDFGGEPAAVANFSFAETAGGSVSFTNSSSNATSYSWVFGDGVGTSLIESPTYTYTSNGTYTACLTASNATSSDETCKDVNVTTVVGIEDIVLNAALNIFPTPASDVMNVSLNGSFSNVTVEVFNMLGESVMAPVNMTSNTVAMNVTNLSEGNYIVKLTSDNGMAVRQISITK